MNHNLLFNKTIVVIILFMMFINGLVSAQSSNELGYVLDTTLQGIIIYSTLESGELNEEIATLSGFTINEEYPLEWNISGRTPFTLSPNRKKMAFVASSDGVNDSLFILDLTTSINEDTQLSFPVSSLPYLLWSPNGQQIYVAPGEIGQNSEFIYDVMTSQIIYTFDESVFSPLWLPDSQQFVYNGKSNCPTSCRSVSDLYLVDIVSGTKIALTQIDANALGLVDQLEFLSLTIEYTTYSPDEQKVYFILAEMLDIGGPRGVMLLASVDLSGNMSIEADLKTIYPSSYSIQIKDIFLQDSNQITIVASVNDNDFYRWSLLKYDLSNVLTLIYERNFPILSLEFQVITSLAVAPSRDYLAIGGSFVEEDGSVIVINLSDGEIIWMNDELNEVCNIDWLDDDNVVYSQPGQFSCSLMRHNIPFERLILHNIPSNISKEIVNEDFGSEQYFISVYPEELPYNYFPFANAGEDQILTDTDGNGSELVDLDSVGSKDVEGGIINYVWSEDDVEIATGSSAQVSLPIGEHIITLTVTDEDNATNTDTVTITIVDDTVLNVDPNQICPTDTPIIDFDSNSPFSYGTTQDINGQVLIEQDGTALRLTGNTWQQINYPYTVTSQTVLDFDFQSSVEGELHSIGFDTVSDDQSETKKKAYTIYGTQNWGRTDIPRYDDFAPETIHIGLPVGADYTDDVSYITFVNDHDVDNPTAESVFSNVQVCEFVEPVPPPDLTTCTAQSIVAYLPGTSLASDGLLHPDRVDPTNALGDAQGTDALNFVSLGFGGELIVDFGQRIMNEDGDDIRITETTYNDSSRSWLIYPEQAIVYASQDNENWVALGVARKDMGFDLGSLEWARYIRIVDASNRAFFLGSGTTTDAFDVDAIEAISTCSPE